MAAAESLAIDSGAAAATAPLLQQVLDQALQQGLLRSLQCLAA
ncbi:hypothetical protein [Pseudomonas anguilliseptica]